MGRLIVVCVAMVVATLASHTGGASSQPPTSSDVKLLWQFDAGG
jgi:hypothetical protein